MKKLTIFVAVVFLLAVTAVPVFAHPDVSDDGLTTAEKKAGTSPVGSNVSDAGFANILSTAAGGNIVAHLPLCGGHPDPDSH